MANRITDSSQADGGMPPPPPQEPPKPPEKSHSLTDNSGKVFKSGPLFISSKGIGWTSWKKRWFILTRTSLVFFRSDPNAIQKGSEVNLTLGGIDLNNSASVVVKTDKKLLTVLFPDCRDGRAFTLKAETMEDLYEWKEALENVLAQAPNASLAMGQNGIFKNDQTDFVDVSLDQLKDKQHLKSKVVGRPILLALEEIDGSPSFLEKSLQFIEEHGVKVEGILRQAADVDDVELRVREYEQGKNEFSADEDPHVIADCVKHVIRELPSSPVPASCCNALLKTCRTDRTRRVSAMREAIFETFPEPNRRLLQRILIMMQTVASHKAENRMSSSAVAACMAPLLLRPLLAGECELESNFDVGGDGSIQLLQAAAAANHAQTIVITLLEEYNNIFGESILSPEIYSDSEESGSGSEEGSYDEESYESDENDDASHESYETTLGDAEHASSASGSENGDTGDDDLSDDKGSEEFSTDSKSPTADEDNQKNFSPISPQTSLLQHNNMQKGFDHVNESISSSDSESHAALLRNPPAEKSSENKLAGHCSSTCIQNSTTPLTSTVSCAGRPTVWGRTSAQRNHSVESVDYPFEEEAEIQKLEDIKADLQSKIVEEAKRNAILQANLERKKETLHLRRLALEQDVARLEEQLQMEKDIRTTLEAGLKKTKEDNEEIALAGSEVANFKLKADDPKFQLNQQRGSGTDIVHTHHTPIHNNTKMKDKHETETVLPSQFPHRSMRSKDNLMDRADYENEGRYDPPNILNRNTSSSNQQIEQAHNSTSKLAPDVSVSSSSTAAKPIASINSKKAPGSRGEGTNTTTSALSKLTTRLHFLKERRTQIANELQNFDKGRDSSKHIHTKEKVNALSNHQSLRIQAKDKDEGSKTQSHQEKKVELGNCQSLPNLEEGVLKEDKSVKNQENIKKSDRKSSGRVLDRGRRLEGESLQKQDRVKSEGQSHMPPRTNSR